jgi:ATP-dependent phosphofructokinase / diphosphate-dependent phosphofructokinase
VPAVVVGVVLAASHLGWKVLGIRDGVDGLLWPERYPAGAMVKLTPAVVQDLSAAGGHILSAAARTDPFRVQVVNAQHEVEEVDRSDALVETLRAAGIDAVVSVVDRRGLGLVHRLHRKGLEVSCVPKSLEHDIAAAASSLGFDTALNEVTEALERARSALSTSHLVVAEVLGEQAGWLALQAGLAVLADAVLIPEIPFDLRKVAERLRARDNNRLAASLVIVAEGAAPVKAGPDPAATCCADPLRTFLAPLASGPEGARAIFRSGQVGESVARELQLLTDRETLPLALGPLIRGSAPTAADRQLGLAYGAGVVRAIERDQYGVMVSLNPPDLELVPLSAAIASVRTVPPGSVFIEAARAIGISLGD